ncbi:MAG: spore germination protein GerW family protein [Clostridia bacterium]|nr:spore germination protein GerW family protein [Clostridia bacterium]
MELNSSLNQNVETLFSNLESFTQKEGIIGKPVTHGDKTFIPVVSVTLGYGGGNTSSNSNQQNNTGSTQGAGMGMGMGNMGAGALGLGARLSTDAVIVIDKDNVSMMQLNMAGNANQLMDKIPQILMGMNPNNQQQGQQGQQQNQQQGQQSGQGQQQ